HQVELLQGRSPPERGGELLQHAVIGALPDRQNDHHKIIGEIAVVLEGGENHDVVPALTTVPRNLDAIALQAAARKKLHNGERDTDRNHAERYRNTRLTQTAVPAKTFNSYSVPMSGTRAPRSLMKITHPVSRAPPSMGPCI